MAESEKPETPIEAFDAGTVEARKRCRDAMPKIVDRLIDIATNAQGRQQVVGVSAARVVAQIAGALKTERGEDKEGVDTVSKAVKQELSKMSDKAKQAITPALRKVS
jgi:hypothetical protein